MPGDEASHVLTQVREGVGIVELNRPDRFNCLSSSVMSGLEGALAQCEADSNVRVVLIRARGRHFCTGADLDEVLDAREDRGRLERFIAEGHRVLRRIETSSLPVVGEVNGLCLAGGLELMMVCDVVFAGRSAQIGCQHARYGLVPGFGGTQRLARIAGQRRALDLMFSGRWLAATEAHAWGLVNHVVDNGALGDAAGGYCAELARKNPDGLAIMKRLCRDGLEGTLSEGLALEQAAVVDALMSGNVTEGLAAFRERREPVFR